jgi:hypothetical protein
MGALIAACGIIAVLVYFICLIENHFWPHMSFQRQFAIATAAVPAAIIATFVGLLIFVDFGPAGPDDVDTGGMVFAVIFFMTGILLVTSLAVGLPVAYYSLRFIRRAK